MQPLNGKVQTDELSEDQEQNLENETNEGETQLIRLDSSQVVAAWEGIKEILRVMSTGDREASDRELSKILESVVTDYCSIWVAQRNDKNVGLLMTSILEEPVTARRQMLIHGLYGASYLGEELWHNGYHTLIAYARSRGASTIVAYSSNRQVLKQCERLGADISRRVIQLPTEVHSEN